jgi:hypothetical protein
VFPFFTGSSRFSVSHSKSVFIRVHLWLTSFTAPEFYACEIQAADNVATGWETIEMRAQHHRSGWTWNEWTIAILSGAAGELSRDCGEER